MRYVNVHDYSIIFLFYIFILTLLIVFLYHLTEIANASLYPMWSEKDPGKTIDQLWREGD